MSPPLSPPPASEMAAWEREAERASLEGPTGPLRLYRMEEFDGLYGKMYSKTLHSLLYFLKQVSSHKHFK